MRKNYTIYRIEMRLCGVKPLRQRSSFNFFPRKVSGFHGSIRHKANF